jgi:DNA repair protein RadC
LRALALQCRVMTLAISTWPATERPREKLLTRGVATLTDAELLAVLFGTGVRGCDVLALARAALQRFGSLRGLLGASRDHCLQLAGLGPARYCSLQAALELARRHYCEALRGASVLASPNETRSFLVAQLRDRPYELFCCLFLDNRHRLIAFEELFRGTIDGASVHPREVLRQALAHNAAAVILVHNHPSGVAEPSQADELITRRLREALALLDIRLLDHLIVAGPQAVSFAERGLI